MTSRYSSFVLCFILQLGSLFSARAVTTNTYPSSSEIFANPERGLYGWAPLTDPGSDYARLRISGVSLCYAGLFLECCRTSPIDQTVLDTIQNNFGKMRDAGLKGIVRIVYDNTSFGQDTTLDWVEAHLRQLQPIFNTNADVIAFFQAGVIGAWGEWHSSQSGLTTPEGRRAVWNLLVNFLPPCTFIQVRTPSFVYELEGNNLPLSDSLGFNCTAPARIGHHNDCWLGSDTDFGTYASLADREAWLQVLQHDTQYVPWGGESCALSSSSFCGMALAEAARLHATYLNGEYHPEVIANLGPCWAEMQRRLGYRFELVSAELPDSIAPGQPFCVRLKIRNNGWAPPYNARPVFLRLFDPSSSVVTTNSYTATADGGTSFGTVAGTYLDTQAANNSYQVITEGQTGGKPNRRTSAVQHRWILNVPSGSSYAFFAQAHRSASSDGDAFVFSYSKDNIVFKPMLQITKTSDDNSYQTYDFPEDVSGTLYIAAEDTDRTAGNLAQNSLSIDHIYVAVTERSANVKILADYALTEQDPRYWRPESGVICLRTTLTAPSSVSNQVGLALWMPDQNLQVRSRPEYSVRFANVGVWNPVRGHNTLISAIPVGLVDPGNCSECNTPEPAVMHVAAITSQVQDRGQGKQSGLVTVRIVDQLGNPVPAATVNGQYSGDFVETVSGLTNNDGVATLATTGVKKGSVRYTFCVTSVSHSSVVYNSSANVETCESY